MVTDEAARGVRLRASRLLIGLSQEEAAKELKVSRTTVSGWENGAAIDEENLEAAAKLYGVSRGWLRYGEGELPAGLTGLRPADTHARGKLRRPKKTPDQKKEAS